MSRRLILLAGLLLALPARAWEEEPAIAFILAWHPVVAAQRTVAASYQPPSLTTMPKPTGCKSGSRKATKAISKNCGSPPRNKTAKRRRSNAWTCC